MATPTFFVLATTADPSPRSWPGQVAAVGQVAPTGRVALAWLAVPTIGVYPDLHTVDLLHGQAATRTGKHHVVDVDITCDARWMHGWWMLRRRVPVAYYAGLSLAAAEAAPVWALERTVDATGVSGTGRVALGLDIDGGRLTALTWRGPHRTIVLYPGRAAVLAVHGHQGATTLRPIPDDDPAARPARARLTSHATELIDTAVSAGGALHMDVPQLARHPDRYRREALDLADTAERSRAAGLDATDALDRARHTLDEVAAADGALL